MKINDMRYVIEVSRWKSINKASKYLYINQQQLSRIIAAVENELSMEIFNRSTRGAFLTEQGEGVVPRLSMRATAGARENSFFDLSTNR